MGIPGRTLGAPSLLLIRPQRVESSAFAESAAPTAGLATPATCTCHPQFFTKTAAKTPVQFHQWRKCGKCKCAPRNDAVDPGRWVCQWTGRQRGGWERQAKAPRRAPRWAVIKDLYLPGNNSCPSPAFQGATPG